MEFNEKKDEKSDDIDRQTESSNANEEPHLDTTTTNEAITDLIPSVPSANQQLSRPQSLDATIENSAVIDVCKQQLSSSSTEPIDQCLDKFIEETLSYEPSANETNDSAIACTTAAQTSNESVIVNINELNNDDANKLESSSPLVELESDCRTETKLNSKLDKSEIIKELTTVSIANCDSSDIVDDSVNVIDLNSCNNKSDGRDNLENQLSCNVAVNENGAKDIVVEITSEKMEQNYQQLNTISPVVAIDSSTQDNSTEKHSNVNDDKVNEQPTSSIEIEKNHSKNDNIPSVHSNISDKGGGTDNEIPQTQQQSPGNKIILNNTVDRAKTSAKSNKLDQEIDPIKIIFGESPKIEICSTGQTDEKVGCDPKHSSHVENQVAYSGSVIRPTNSIVSNINVNPHDDIKSSSQLDSCIIGKESLPRVEVQSIDINIKTSELKPKSTYIQSFSNPLNAIATSKNLNVNLTQPHSSHSSQNSLYVSNPDFSRTKKSTEDLSSLRMKPPDFSKLSQAYSTNNLKIPNPNFNDMDGPLKLYQSPINPANFAEISKRLNYISDLQLKTDIPSTHTNSIDRSQETNRNLSHLYVKAPDFSTPKTKSSHHDQIDEPTAHVIHKNPYPIQEKSSKIIASQQQQSSSDPSIIYRNYPQISQDVTMSIVPTHNAQFQPHHPLSQKQNIVEQSVDQRFKQNYPHEEHKGHPSMYGRADPSPHNLPENRVTDSSFSLHTKTMNMSYKHKADQVSGVHPYQRENSRAAVIQSGKSSGISIMEAYSQKVQFNYVQRNEMSNPYEKPVAKSAPSDYMHVQPHFNNSRCPTEFTENRSNYERTVYCEGMPGLYQEHYKQSPSTKHNSSSNATPITAPSNHRLLHSPIINSKPIDIPSGGHMNPPQYWPSHSPRITQSPISLSSSPLSGRITQSPAGASQSPQHHVVHTPSALPAQSPTYRYSSPHQAQTPSPYNVPTIASSSVQFKEAANPTMFQKPCKSKSSKTTKVAGIQSNSSNYYYLPPESSPHSSHQYSVKVEQSAYYPQHQYSIKTDNNLREDTTRTKQTKNKIIPDYVDLTKSSRPSDTPSSNMPSNMVGPDNHGDYRFINERHELQHRPETLPNKSHASELNRTADKHVYNSQQKTIMDPYAYRKASEADLNYEIIKKTLNKDISIKRSDTDLSCSIFDTPKSNLPISSNYQMSNGQYYGRVTTYPPNFNYQPPPPDSSVRRDSKVADVSRYYSSTAQPRHDVEQPSRSNNSRPPNDLKRHDLSVTVSRISAAVTQPIEQSRLQHSETTVPINQQPSASRHETNFHASNTHLPQMQPVIPQKPSSSVKSGCLNPLKRESPLDLSVKTVKTKADSTGDDYAMPSSSRDYNAPLSLKVDFSPNFQNSCVQDKIAPKHTQPLFENAMANSHYPAVHRPNLQVGPNVAQRNAGKLATDAKYEQRPPQSNSPSTHGRLQVAMGGAPTQVRSNQMPNDLQKHQAKPLVLNPTVPTVFGRKPEELKNLPINPDIQDYKTSYGNDHRTKNQTIKSNYHNKPPEHLPSLHHKPHETPAKFSDFKTKNVQEFPEASKDRTRYGYVTDERTTFVGQYQEQRPTHLTSNSTIVESTPPSHYDQYYSRKRPAEQPPPHDQHPTAKQIRSDDPHNKHSHYYNLDKIYPSTTNSKGYDRYEMPAEISDFHPRFSTSDERTPSVDLRDNIKPTTVVRDNIAQNYGKQHPYHYPEPTYNQMENKEASYPPMMSYPKQQHQKHLAYQKRKKEAYDPSQACSQPYHPYDHFKSEPYQPHKHPEAKPFYSESGCISNQQYTKQQQDKKPLQQVYQQTFPKNQTTLQADSSKEAFYPTTEIQNYRDVNQSAQAPQLSSDTISRANHRMTSTDVTSSRHQTTLKGADQTVISKLRTNLEMKEIEKQKMLRNQSSTETLEEDNQKSDIASLIAARIRTKGELKGFTPVPAAIDPKPYLTNRCEVENKKDIPLIVTTRDLGADGDNVRNFDLLDWGSACNDFVEQLQGAGNKKRGRRKRGKSALIDTDFETVKQEVTLRNLPGIDYKCDIDEGLVNIVKAENKTLQEGTLNQSTKKDEDSSSDEDKPLLFLRQKSLNELGKSKLIENDDDINGSSTLSESTKQFDKRTDVLTKLSEKIAKNKKEQQREKRENEKRVSIASSSESEDDVSSKVNTRSKKTVRKPRTRSSVGYKNTSDDETSENGSKNSKRKNDHTKRKKSSKSSSDSEPLKQGIKISKIESGDRSETENEDKDVQLVSIKQEVISDEETLDCKIRAIKTPTKKDLGVISVKIEETMTRSKRKQELERQKANSKILRNDKMVKNVQAFDRKLCDPKKLNEKNTSKPKNKSGCKDATKRKLEYLENEESSKGDSTKKKVLRLATIQALSSDSEEIDINVSLRRRTRSAKSIDQRTPEKLKHSADKVVEKKWFRNTPQKKTGKESVSKPTIEQFPPGWENEVYEFKRSLKIPASLITIKRPSWYRKSISLPDLDPHSSDTSETFSEKKQLFLKPLNDLSDRRIKKKESKHSRLINSNSTNENIAAEVSNKLPADLRSKSIIDLLHQKIIHPVSSRLSKKSRLQHSNEPKLLPQSNEIELLPTPGAENVFKQISVFETAVLKSRTRKEYRVQKNQEIIREVFGCDDRPASAPPLHANPENKVPAITFDQKYKQYLEKMNMDFSNRKLPKCEIAPDVLIVKQEKIEEDSLLNDEIHDIEINKCERNRLHIKEEPIDSNERDTPSVSEREGITPSSFSLIRKRGRGARSGRRKGSSGFDYIRKKKKPLSQPTEGTQQKRRSAAINYLQEKDENDINREIRGWVLNKGVGETVLHKAARLGYIDVIAFCLERLDMNPDQKDNAGYTALHEACSRGHLDIARLLLEYGANHSETAVLGGIRPLHEAVENGYIEVVRLLLSYGSDPLLATYSGQTPIMLAENDEPMTAFLKNYVLDIQNTGPNKMPWRFEGSWKKYDTEEYGYDMFDDIPNEENEKRDKANVSATVETIKQIKTSNKCDSNSNIMLMKSTNRKRPTHPILLPENHRTIKSKYKNLSPCTVVLTNLSDKNNTTKANGASKQVTPSLSTTNQIADIPTEQPEIIEFSDDDSDADLFEIEESQAPHVPLYHLRDEGPVKWALLSDLCYMLKVKSKDTLLKQICSTTPSSVSNKELLRELKMGDFLERATCLQLLCAGEKLNIRSSKVVLVKYNDSVKNLLGIKTVLMKM